MIEIHPPAPPSSNLQLPRSNLYPHVQKLLAPALIEIATRTVVRMVLK